MSDGYEEFLSAKRIEDRPSGFDASDINPQLFDFQKAIVLWALRRGRAAIFADCGLGKSPIQLEWARHVHQHTGGNVLILAPLAVTDQTQREGVKFGIPVTVCRTTDDVRQGINVANYERLHYFADLPWSGVVLDESSILKSYDGSTRKALTAFAATIPYRLCCTATPAPNDLIELTNHAEFLSVMSGKEIIALFFTQDGNTTHSWRLKGHAKEDFWKWLASWSVAVRKPSDLGFADDRFVLPALHLNHVVVSAKPAPGMLFPVDAASLNEVRAAQRESLEDRVAACAAMVNDSKERWLVWCNLNVESDALRREIPDAVEVKGSDSLEDKEQRLRAFTDGHVRVLISKPSICGWGLNWQHCHNIVFVGLSYSYEAFYQAVRRCWRFGQEQEVTAHVVTAQTEGAVVASIERKEQQASEMFDNIVAHMQGLQCGRSLREEAEYKQDVAHGDDWSLYLGDSVHMLNNIADESVGLSVFSPPFPGMYTYSNSRHDVGNCESIDHMMDHFRFIMPGLLRVTMPGRMCCIHLMQLTAMKSRDGYIGIKDYRGRVIAAMEGSGWVFAGEVTIDKNPQVQAVRNKERGLLFKTLAHDSSLMRMALADYMLYFRKAGDNPLPIKAGISERYSNQQGWITEEEWIEWAAPVWYRRVTSDGRRSVSNYPATKQTTDGIMETDVLNVSCARESEDERHLCPLQLGVIERAVKLWSAPRDLVLDPFAGIGSTGYMALKLNRRFVGVELKESYWRTAQSNLARALSEREQLDLFARRTTA